MPKFSIMPKQVLLVLALLAVFVLTACGEKQGSETEDAVSDVVVAQWGSERYLIYLPLYIAQENGYFEDENIEVSLEYSGNDDQVFAKVLRGDAQFGVGDPIFTAVSRQRGADGVVLATIVGKVALWGVSNQELDIEQASQFTDLRIGTFPRPSTAYTLLRNTISKPEVSGAEIVEVPIGNELPLLESGSADVVMMLEPAASIAESKGYNIVSSFPVLWGEFEFTGLTSTEEYVDEHPQVADAMVRALERAVHFAHGETDATIDLASELFPDIDRSVIAAAVQRMLDDQTLPTSVQVDEAAWEKSMRVRQDVGDVEEGFLCKPCLYQPR